MNRYYSFRRNGKFLHGTEHHFRTVDEAERYGTLIHADELIIKSNHNENSTD